MSDPNAPPPPPAATPPAASASPPPPPPPPAPPKAQAAPPPPLPPAPAPRPAYASEIEPAGPPPGPKVDLTKRFHLKAGIEPIASFDTRDEVDEAKAELEQHKAEVIAEASRFTHMGKLSIIDRGATHPSKD